MLVAGAGLLRILSSREAAREVLQGTGGNASPDSRQFAGLSPSGSPDLENWQMDREMRNVRQVAVKKLSTEGQITCENETSGRWLEHRANYGRLREHERGGIIFSIQSRYEGQRGFGVKSNGIPIEGVVHCHVPPPTYIQSPEPG